MRRTYKLGEDKILTADVWGELMPDEIKVLCTKIGVGSREYKRPLYKDKNGDKYFVFDKQRVYLDNFEFNTVSELVDMLDSRARVSSSELLATLLKDTENVGLVLNCSVLEAAFHGVCAYGSETVPVLCVPVTNGRYPKNRWSYKIEFMPDDERLRGYVSNSAFYLDDLVGLIQRDQEEYRLVNLGKARMEIEEARQIQAVEDEKLWNRIKRRLFGAKQQTHKVIHFG